MKNLYWILIAMSACAVPAYADTPSGPNVREHDASGNGITSTVVGPKRGIDVYISNSTTGLTDAELRATPVPVSGPLTDAQLRATAVPVSGSVSVSNFPASQAVTGTFFQATQPISASSLPLPSGAATSALQSSILSALGSPFQAGASIGNTSFAISGTLPAFASTPTVNLGTIGSAATAANQATEISSLSSIDTKLTAPLATKAPVNVTGSGSAAGATVSTVVTLTAPANAVGFILMNLDVSTTNMRWAVGRTASTTLGQQLQPGRDTGFVPVGANISIIAESGTVTYDVQWVSQ